MQGAFWMRYHHTQQQQKVSDNWNFPPKSQAVQQSYKAGERHGRSWTWELGKVCKVQANLFIYQARESNVVPVGVLTAHFPQKL